MKVTFTLNLDSAAFYDAPEHQIRQAFAQAANLVCYLPVGPSGGTCVVLDTNGRPCGKVVVR